MQISRNLQLRLETIEITKLIGICAIPASSWICCRYYLSAISFRWVRELWYNN